MSSNMGELQTPGTTTTGSQNNDSSMGEHL